MARLTPPPAPVDPRPPLPHSAARAITVRWLTIPEPPRALDWPATRMPEQAVLDRVWKLTWERVREGVAAPAVSRVLASLRAFDGDTWQARWSAAGCLEDGADWVECLGVPRSGLSEEELRHECGLAARCLMVLDVIRPSYDWFTRTRTSTATKTAMELRDPGFLEKVAAFAAEHGHALQSRGNSMTAIGRMILFTGKSVRELVEDDLAYYRQEQERLGNKVLGVAYAWDLLKMYGAIGADRPSFREVYHRGQATVEEIVDYYDLRCGPIRDMMVRYITARAPAVDYNTLRQLAYKLAGKFWKEVEQLDPDLAGLVLSPDVAARWKAKMRADHTYVHPVFMAVRSLYLDIAQWATQDAYWAQWAAPCFLSREDILGQRKHKLRIQAQIHQKIRHLVPSMPQILATVDEYRRKHVELLEIARAVPPGEVFTFDGVDYARAFMRGKKSEKIGGESLTGRVWLTNLATGKRHDQVNSEDKGFWAWAVINTFYYTGIRLEELSEITATALFTYRVPGTGEVVPLLQIVPSKTDQERVLLVPPELAHVLAAIRHRVRAGADNVPCVARFDGYERTFSAPLPYLFQRLHGTQRRTISPTHMTNYITEIIAKSGLTGPNGEPLRITAHDFRRIFATEALSGGLPVHILAKVMGHQSIATTQGYTAVFQEDVIKHYRKFVASRRSLRPTEEYRQPTNSEMEEFHKHFTKRKLELGICARPYGTPCVHEHACIRCAMLQPDPSQKHRLKEIIQSLHERVKEAEERGWLGEIEGLEISIAAANEKLDRMQKLVQLGIPQLSTRPVSGGSA